MTSRWRCPRSRPRWRGDPAGAIPVVLGGDHSIAFPDAKGVANVLGHGRISMIHFDAHADTGDIEFGSLWGHGQPMRRLIESGALRGDRFLQVGLRGYWPPPETLDWMAGQRMRSFEMTEIVHRGLQECLTEAFAIATDECDGVFLSVDIDVCDPGHAPGTGTPEPGGLSRPRAARLRCAASASSCPWSGSTSSRSARPTTTPTSPPRWPTALCWRPFRPSPAGVGTSATGPAGTPPAAARGPGARADPAVRRRTAQPRPPPQHRPVPRPQRHLAAQGRPGGIPPHHRHRGEALMAISQQDLIASVPTGLLIGGSLARQLRTEALSRSRTPPPGRS